MSEPARSGGEATPDGVPGDLDLELTRLGDIPDPVAFESDPASSSAGGRGSPFGSPEERAPTRAEARRRRTLAAGVAAAWIVAVVVVLGLRGDLGHGGVRTLVQIVLPALAGAVVLGVALASGAGGLGSRTGRLVAAFGVAATLFPVSAFLGSGVFLDDKPGVLTGIAKCAALVLVIGGVPLAALAVGLRRAFPANAPWRSVLVAGASGLFGASALGTHCSTHCGVHMALGHAIPAVLLAFVGGALLVRVTRA